MRGLTDQGEKAVTELAARYGVSTDAVRALLEAVRRGNGTMAQFSHPELGGGGQWMASGMTMVGDMFNDGLRATVSGLASDLSSLLASTPVFEPTSDPVAPGGPGPVHQANPGSWWPVELGRPSSAGGQNDSHYAVFPAARRLAVRHGGGPVRVYDTLDHVIGGVQQGQGGPLGTLSFTSQHGTFTVDSLRLVSPAPTAPPAPEPDAGPAPAPPSAPARSSEAPERTTTLPTSPAPPTSPASPASAPTAGTEADAVLATLDRLGDLHRRGVLTDEEFAAKKAELLSRL